MPRESREERTKVAILAVISQCDGRGFDVSVPAGSRFNDGIRSSLAETAAARYLVSLMEAQTLSPALVEPVDALKASLTPIMRIAKAISLSTLIHHLVGDERLRIWTVRILEGTYTYRVALV